MLRNWFFSRVMQPFLKTILYLNYLPQLQSGIKLPVTDRFSWFFRICPCHAKPTTGRILLRLDLNCVICKAITVFHVDIPFTKNFVPISIRIGKLRVLHLWNLSCKFHWYQKKNSFTFRHSQLIDIENCLLRIPGLVEFLSSNHPYMLITCICRRNKNLGNASWLHTPVVGNSLNTAYKCRLHKPAVCKSLRSPLMCWSHTPAVGKSLRNKPKCWSDTPAQGKSLMVVLTRWSHTPAVGKSLTVTPTCWSHTPAVGKSLGYMPTQWSHTPAVGKSLGDTHTRWSHAPAVGKSLK